MCTLHCKYIYGRLYNHLYNQVFWEHFCVFSKWCSPIKQENMHLTRTVICPKPLWWPLHTRAKSRDHEIVRAQKTVSKGHPTHLEHHVVWSRTLNCSVKSYATRPSTKCYFNEVVVMRVLTHDKIKLMNSCERSECHGIHRVRPTSKRWFLKIPYQEGMVGIK
jgi:hypothetical protein